MTILKNILTAQNVIIRFFDKKMGRDITGEYCFSALHGLDEICPWCREQDVFKGETIRWEYKLPKTGRWYNYMASPIYNTDGSISKLTLCNDILVSPKFFWKA